MTEEKLIQELKDGIIRRVYYLHGKETFLVEMFAGRIRDKCLQDDDSGFNLVKFRGNPDMSALAESVETLPVFAEKRVIMLNDLDVEKLDAVSLDNLLSVVSSVSESTCVIIYATGFNPDVKKAKAKKLLECIAGVGKKGKDSAVLNFDKMTETKTAELIIKRVGRMGCTISRDNAALLARICLRNLTLIACETDKMCAYADYKGEITRKSIEMLTVRQLDSGVFALAAEITSKRGANAMLLLDELVEQGNQPVAIMAALSTTFIDFYRAKIASSCGKTAEHIVRDFSYPPNRAWAVRKAMTAVSRLTVSKVRGCVDVLCDTDYKLKSSPLNDRIIMERAIARLLVLC